MPDNYVFTSESVSEGHPDKVADQVSDAIGLAEPTSVLVDFYGTGTIGVARAQDLLLPPCFPK